MAVTHNLESLLLRPQATEVSYKYIESLILKRIEDRTLFSHPSVDTTADIIDLLSSTLYRAGSGWVQVVALNLSKNVVLAILQQIQTCDPQASAVLDALARLLQSFPVLSRCSTKSLSIEVMRILSVNPLVTPALMGLLTALLNERTTSQELRQLAVSKAICFLTLSKDRNMAVSCLTALVAVPEFILKDAQIHNSALAACAVASAEFGEDIEIRRLCRVIEELEPNRTFSGPEAEEDMVEPLPSTILPMTEEAIEPETKKVRSAELSENQMAIVESSPRSSCPSLDF